MTSIMIIEEVSLPNSALTDGVPTTSFVVWNVNGLGMDSKWQAINSMLQDGFELVFALETHHSNSLRELAANGGREFSLVCHNLTVKTFRTQGRETEGLACFTLHPDRCKVLDIGRFHLTVKHIHIGVITAVYFPPQRAGNKRSGMSDLELQRELHNLRTRLQTSDFVAGDTNTKHGVLDGSTSVEPASRVEILDEALRKAGLKFVTQSTGAAGWDHVWAKDVNRVAWNYHHWIRDQRISDEKLSRISDHRPQYLTVSTTQVPMPQQIERPMEQTTANAFDTQTSTTRFFIKVLDTEGIPRRLISAWELVWHQMLKFLWDELPDILSSCPDYNTRTNALDDFQDILSQTLMTMLEDICGCYNVQDARTWTDKLPSTLSDRSTPTDAQRILWRHKRNQPKPLLLSRSDDMDLPNDTATFMATLHEEARVPMDCNNRQDFLLETMMANGTVVLPSKPKPNDWSTSITRGTVSKFYGGYPLNKAGDRTGVHQKAWRCLIQCFSFTKFLRDYHRCLAEWQLVPRQWKDMDYALIPKTAPGAMTFTIDKARPIGLMDMMRRCHEYTQVMFLRRTQKRDATLHSLQPEFATVTENTEDLPWKLQHLAENQNALAARLVGKRPSTIGEVKTALIRAGQVQLPEQTKSWAVLPVNQHAFRQQWSALAQETLMHEVLTSHKDARALLLDLSSAFNKVLLDKLLTTIKTAGFPQYMINGIATLFLGTVVRVRLPDGSRSRAVHCGVGVPQGGAMGPILFNHSCRELSTTLNRTYQVPLAKSFMFGECPVTHSFQSLQAYADDNTVLALSRADAIDGLNKITAWCEESNMSLSATKSAYLSRPSSPPLGEIQTMALDKHLGFKLTGNGIDVIKHLEDRCSTFKATCTAISFAAQDLAHWTRAIMVRVNAMPALEWGLGILGHATFADAKGSRQQVLDLLNDALNRAVDVVFKGTRAGHPMVKLAMLNIPTPERLLHEWEARHTYHLRHRISVHHPVVAMMQAALLPPSSFSAVHTVRTRVFPHAATHQLYCEWILSNQELPIDEQQPLRKWFQRGRFDGWIKGGKSQPYLKTVLYMLPGRQQWGGMDASIFAKDATARSRLILWRFGVPLDLECPTCLLDGKLDRGHMTRCNVVENWLSTAIPEAEQQQLTADRLADTRFMHSLVPEADIDHFSLLDVMLNHRLELAERFILSLHPRGGEIIQQPP